MLTLPGALPTLRSESAPVRVTFTEPPNPLLEPVELRLSTPLVTTSEPAVMVMRPGSVVLLKEPGAGTVDIVPAPTTIGPEPALKVSDPPKKVEGETVTLLGLGRAIPPAPLFVMVMLPPSPVLDAACTSPATPLTEAEGSMVKGTALLAVSFMVPPVPSPGAFSASGPLMNRLPAALLPAVRMSVPAEANAVELARVPSVR